MAGTFNRHYDDYRAFARTEAVRDEELVVADPGAVRRASFGTVFREGRFISEEVNFHPFVQDRAKLYEELTGENSAFMRTAPTGAMSFERRRIREMLKSGELFRDESGLQSTSNRGRSMIKAFPDHIRSSMEIDRMSALHPGVFLTDEEIDGKVSEKLRILREQDDKVLARSESGLQEFTGAAGAIMTDPVILGSMLLGAGEIAGASKLLNAGKAFITEAIIGTAVEVPIQAKVFQFKDRIDSPYTFKDAAYNVLAAAVGGGVLRATGSVTVDVAADGLARFKAARARRKPATKPPLRDEERQAVEELEDYVREGSANPVGVENEAAHLDAVDKVAMDLEANRVPDVEEIVGDLDPVTPDPDIPGGRVYRAEDIETFDPRDLEVDADLFQFKTGGDDEGVTRAFKDIDTFRIEQAGQVIVYETTDGARFIVDGHQRLGIARRAVAGGQDPDTVKLFGVVLRESDGVTVAQARQMAAFKNIAEGTGTGIDAAKIIRGLSETELGALPQLPRAGVIASRGKTLARLHDDSFMAVVNEVVPEDQAAIVGELLTDAVLQKAAIDTLARVQPANQTQAREVIKQVREAGAVSRETGDLFGDTIAETLFLERARVVDDSMRRLRTETRTFKTLVQRQEAIEGAGTNVLDTETNLQQVLDNGKAIEILQREAHTKGPTSDAVQRAAEQLKAGESRATVTESFLREFNDANTRGDGAGVQAGGARATEAPEFVEDNAPRPAAAKGEAANPVEGTQVEKADQLARLSDENEKIIDDMLAEVDRKFGTESNSSRKTQASIINKANRPSILEKKPWFNVEYLRDSFRFRSVVDDIDDIDRVFTFMRENAATRGVKFIKIDIEKQLTPGEWGWRMVAIDMEMPNGQLVEFYSPVRELRDAQGGTRPGQTFNNHDLFEKWRKQDITALSPEDKAAYLVDVEESAKWYQEAWDAYLARTGQTESDVSSSLKRLVASASPAGTKKPAISSPVRDMPGDELQPSAVLKKKPASDITTAETERLPGSRKTETLGMDTGTTSKASIPESDLAGPVDRGAQDLADATRARDEARQGARDVGVDEGEFFGQGGRLEADLFDDTNPLSTMRREAELFDDGEAEAAIKQATEILNDQDVDLPTELISRGDQDELVIKGGRVMMEELDEADQAIIDVAVCNRRSAA